jgi:hypothetical protein
MSLAFLFHYFMLNMFRMLIHPSWGACDLFVELFHGLYCSGTMCVGVTVWFGWGGVVSLCRLKLISLFHAQHVSDVNTSILRSLRLICWVISWLVLLWYDVCWCYGVVRLGWSGILVQAEAQHASNVSTSILRSLRLICRVVSWVVMLWFDVYWFYGVVRLGWCGILMQAEALVLQPA